MCAQGLGSTRSGDVLGEAVTREGETKSVIAGQSDARLKIWCYNAVPCNFQSKHSLPRPCAAFLFSCGKPAGLRRNGIPSFWKYLSPVLPSYPLIPTASLFKGFPCCPWDEDLYCHS